MESSIIEFLVSMAQNHPWASVFVVVLGVFRSIFKPIMSLIEAYVLATPSQTDDLWLSQLKASKIYLGLVWFVDYTLSVKLPK